MSSKVPLPELDGQKKDAPASGQSDILIVGADRDQCRQIGRHLEGAGHQVVIIAGAADAIDWLIHHQAELLVLHGQVTDATSEEFITSLRVRGLGQPIIVVSTHDDKFSAVRLMKQGAVDILWDGPELLEKLQTVVDRALENLAGHRKAAATQAAVWHNEERLRLALEAARMSTWEWNFVTGRVTYSNGIPALFGATPGDGLETRADFVERIHPEDVSTVEAAVKASVESGEDFRCVFRTVFPDGSIHWVGTRGQVMLDGHGRPAQIIGVSQDLTDRMQFEAALQAIVKGTASVTGAVFFQELVRLFAVSLQVRWACIVELVSPGDNQAHTVAMWDTDRLCSEVNYDLRGTPCEQVLKEDLSYYREGVREAFPLDVMAREIGMESYLGVPIRDKSGEAVGILCVMHDRPMEPSMLAESILRIFAGRAAAELERNKAEEVARRRLTELAHVTRLATIGEMVSQLAHEINQPLYAIGNFAEACTTALETEPEQRREEVLTWTRHIRAQVRRVAEIIRSLRRYVRNAPVRRTRLCVNDLIQDVIQFLQMDERYRAVELELHLESPMPAVYIDRVQLEQVMVNVILNAAEAMADAEPALRTLEISTSHVDDDWIQIKVRDVGHGVGTEDMDRLFEPFFTTKPEGMGMGLAISRSLIQEQGGRMWATQNPDRGLTLWITLPLLGQEIEYGD